jgi:hypothetical protein
MSCDEFGLVDLSASGVNFADLGVWTFCPRMLVLRRVQRSDFQASKRSGSRDQASERLAASRAACRTGPSHCNLALLRIVLFFCVDSRRILCKGGSVT